MAREQRANLIDRIRRAVLTGAEADPSDGQLLECFVSRRDEAAVAALVRRHGPMVWGVCRRLLRCHHDAEDAFQATFLVLVRKAASVRPREAVGNWLYGVARTTALKARATIARRQAREKPVSEMPEPEAVPDPAPWHEVEPLLDQELSRLPAKYRMAIVLCDLEGRARKDVARQLNVPEGTLSSRLTTARTMLARRLTHLGLVLPGGALAVVLSQEAASASVPAGVVLSTIRAATLLAGGKGVAGAASAKVAILTEGVLKTMLITKLKVVAVVLLTVSLIGLGTTVITYRSLASDRGGATDDAATREAAKGREEAQDVERPGAVAAERGKARAGGEKEGKEEPAEGQASENAKLRGLLKERLEAVRTLADQVKRLNKQGTASQEAVQRADLRVYRAELDLCETAKERVAVLEKIAKVYKDMEEHTSALEKKGVASSESVLEAKLSRLEAEIAVEREKAKVPKSSK